MMTENMVFAAFCAALDAAKTRMGIPDEWLVLARNPQNMVRTDGVVIVDKISQRRRGFQNERYETDADGTLRRYWEWIEEYRFQVSVARQRKVDDTPDTVTADEVASLLRAWVNSVEGAETMRKSGLAPLFVFDVANQSYQDENGVYQYFPHFDVAVEVVQVKEFATPPVDAVDLGIRHVPLCPAESAGEIDYERVWEAETQSGTDNGETDGTDGSSD